MGPKIYWPLHFPDFPFTCCIPRRRFGIPWQLVTHRIRIDGLSTLQGDHVEVWIQNNLNSIAKPVHMGWKNGWNVIVSKKTRRKKHWSVFLGVKLFVKKIRSRQYWSTSLCVFGGEHEALVWQLEIGTILTTLIYIYFEQKRIFCCFYCFANKKPETWRDLPSGKSVAFS